MDARHRFPAIALGLALLLHGLGHAVLPMRAADVAAPGVTIPGVSALYVLAMLGFVAAGLGLLGVHPLSRAVVPAVLVSGVLGLGAQAWAFDVDLWPGVLLNVLLPILTTLYVALLPVPVPATGRRPRWKQAGDLFGMLFLVWVSASAALWPWHRTWGAAPQEWSMSLPGDHVPRTPAFEVLHGVTIDAPPAAVWPWLVQLGQDRAGFYSYDWLERLFLADVHNTKELRPEWQQRHAGDRVYATQQGYFGGVFGNRPGWLVSYVEPERVIVLQNWGTFALVPTPDGRTRFLIRSTMSGERVPVWAAAVSLTAFQLPHFIMQRKMMLTIKSLSEQTGGVTS